MTDLRCRWSKRERDLLFIFPRKADGSLLAAAFTSVEIHGKTLRAHLEERGYDITTLRFSIKPKEPQQ